MDLDAPLRYRACWENVPVAGATVAIEDRQAEGIHVVRRERCGPSVQREFANTGPVDGSPALRLTPISVGHDQEVPSGALEDDVTGLVVELQVAGGNVRVIPEDKEIYSARD